MFAALQQAVLRAMLQHTELACSFYIVEKIVELLYKIRMPLKQVFLKTFH